VIPANTIQKGTVLSDLNLSPPWQLWVVLEVSHDDVLIKRPYTNQGKSFIVFEEARVPLSQLTSNRYQVARI
jgi:hypothetical protein